MANEEQLKKDRELLEAWAGRQKVREEMDELLQAQARVTRAEVTNLLREHSDWIWGHICDRCYGTGVPPGEEKCDKCKGDGIIDWNVEGFIEKFLEQNDGE